MNFIEKHWQYIEATATAKAVEIAQLTGKWDIDDHKQSMFLFLVKRVKNYRPEAGSPHTYINVILRSAKMEVMRQMNRQKNQIISQARQIDSYV